MNGLFISFEGIDGAGKSTHIDALRQAFAAQGRQVTLTREPGGTPLAERLRELVLHHTMDGLTESLLVFAARRDHLQQLVLPALQRGEVVLCDRFADASFAYQGGGRGVQWQLLQTLEAWVQGADAHGLPLPSLLQPQLTLWFDLPPAVAATRLAGARLPDRFESQPLAFFEHVSAGYARRQQENPQRFARIQADQSAAAVWASVVQVLQQRGWLHP